MALFAQLVSRLGIPDQFLDTYSPAVRARLREAARKFAVGASPNDGLNHCLHLASSVVLRNPDHLDEALDAVRVHPLLGSTDPATVLTVATFYFLLHRELGKLEAEDAEDRAALHRVQDAFDHERWLVGEAAMRALGIEPCAEPTLIA